MNRKMRYLCIVAILLLCTIFMFKGLSKYKFFLTRNKQKFIFNLSGWSKDYIIDYKFDVNKKDVSYKIYVTVEYINAYKYSNIHLDYIILYEGVEIEKGEKNYDLFDVYSGKPLGSKNLLSNSIVLSLPITTLSKMDLGKYELKLKHRMRENCLLGIKNAEILVEEAIIKKA